MPTWDGTENNQGSKNIRKENYSSIRHRQSPYTSSIITVKKKGGNDRLCVGYRILKPTTVRDRYTSSRIDD